MVVGPLREGWRDVGSCDVPRAVAEVSAAQLLVLTEDLGEREGSDKNRRYRNKGGRKFRANLRKFGKHNGLTPPCITNTFGKFPANLANFVQIRTILFLSAIV